MTTGGPTHDQVIILGAGRAVRGAVPSAMVGIDEHGRVMDWLLHAFGELPAAQLCFVGGYKAEDVVERYPDVHIAVNRDWARTGPVHSLALAPLDPRVTTYVCYADVIFRRSAVALVRDSPGDLVVAVDTRWRDRYDRRSRSDMSTAEKVHLGDGLVDSIGTQLDAAAAGAEFAGLLRLRGAATEAVIGAVRAGSLLPGATLPDLIAHLLDRGFPAAAVDLKGEWAELNAKQDLARFVLGTKAESLDRLRQMSHGGEIGELVSFTLDDWTAAPDAVAKRILDQIPGTRLMVRSSALVEDGWNGSAAGRFASIADVGRSPSEIKAAIGAVFGSYESDHGANQVLVQEMLSDVAMSGVVMTRTHTLGAPYYVINFDDSSPRTDTVTGGGNSRTVFLHRGARLRDELPAQLQSVVTTVESIEKLVGHDSLDVEFAVTTDGRVHILQVRPIAVRHTSIPIDDDQVAAVLVEARRFLGERATPPPNLVGRRTRYSVMADWNPAEIIGTKPKRLAFSLYRYLITDEVWAKQRAEFGYRDVRPCPLLVDIVGHPYVDVRATFTSFLPCLYPNEQAARLVDHYIDRLEAHPQLHDKVEFEVLFTCLTADFDARTERLAAAGFTADEIGQLRDALRNLTIAGIHGLDPHLDDLALLDPRIGRIRASGLAPLERAYHQLQLVRRFGALTFGHLARTAFVATALVRSLVAVGALTRDEYDAFVGGVDTVLGHLQRDGSRVATGEVTWDDFVDVYGHLRPGTYDITSPCYRSAAEAYLRPVVKADHPPRLEPEPWSDATRAKVSGALDSVGLPSDVDRFQSFAGRAIASRELGKFVITRALSDALEALAEWGAGHNLTRDDLAHISIIDLLLCRDAIPEPSTFLACRALEGREAHHVAQGVCLPGQIATADDLVCFEQEAAEPNFVTQRVAEGAVVAADLDPWSDIDGRIVLIANADPGFDWLLARPVAGLITAYGGANSHMAVRAAELGLPAAIGVGEPRYTNLESAVTIRLDCASRTITVVH